MYRIAVIIFSLLLFIPSVTHAQLHKNNVAVCSSSKGYGYYAQRNLMTEGNVGWKEDKNLTGSMTFKKYDDGKLDLIFTDATRGSYSGTEEGASILPVSISENAASIVLIYPNQLSEAYVFQRLKSGEFQVMWTQAKAETPFPKVAAWVGKCSYLNLKLLTNK